MACMHGFGVGTQAGSATVAHAGIQCELLLPPVTTSTPTKANVAVPEPNIFYVSDIDDDDNVADITQSSIYQETTSVGMGDIEIYIYYNCHLKYHGYCKYHNIK